MPVGRPIGTGPIWVGPIGPSPSEAASEVIRDITSNSILELPIDCVLAGQQTLRRIEKESYVPPTAMRTNQRTLKSMPRRLSGATPSFTVKTGSKGYD